MDSILKAKAAEPESRRVHEQSHEAPSQCSRGL